MCIRDRDDSVQKGIVISSTPAAGTNVDKGTIITLFVSKGNESADMPDVVNMSLEAAKSQLEGMGLKVKVENVEAVSYTHLDVYKRQQRLTPEDFVRRMEAQGVTAVQDTFVQEAFSLKGLNYLGALPEFRDCLLYTSPQRSKKLKDFLA